MNHADPGVVANALICLIHQTNYLLDRQIAGLERQFIQDGGYSERLAAARIEERKRQDRTDRSDPTDRTKQNLPPLPALRQAPGGAYRPPGCARRLAISRLFGLPELPGNPFLDGSVRSDRSV